MDDLSNVKAFTHTAKNAKYQRIDAIPWDKGVINIRKDMQPYKEIHREHRSYNQTPSTPTRKDDGLDCISMIVFKHGRYLRGGKKIDWTKRRLSVT